jgi:hypothetical protein
MTYGRKMNADWHKKNRMPKNPSIAQRARWHLAHSKACGCREIPKSIRPYLAKKDKEVNS